MLRRFDRYVTPITEEDRITKNCDALCEAQSPSIYPLKHPGAFFRNINERKKHVKNNYFIEMKMKCAIKDRITLQGRERERKRHYDKV